MRHNFDIGGFNLGSFCKQAQTRQFIALEIVKTLALMFLGGGSYQIFNAQVRCAFGSVLKVACQQVVGLVYLSDRKSLSG